MIGLIESGEAGLQRAAERLEAAAQNIANMTTPGYKAHRLFAPLVELGTPDSLFIDSQAQEVRDWTQGKLLDTGSPFDLAIAGSGFFVVRAESGDVYTRNGQFQRDADGRLVTSSGLPVQSEAGDVELRSDDVTILADGTVLDGGEPVARLLMVEPEAPERLRAVGPGLFFDSAAAMRAVAQPVLRQGMIEASNVSTADEMLAMMAALRSAESAQRVVQLYDDLTGRALTAFGQV